MSKNILDSGMTLLQLSQKANIPYTTIQEYLSAGKDIRKCSLGTFKALASALGMTMDNLYEKLSQSPQEQKPHKYADLKIPEMFRVFFWDRDFDNLDLDKETDFIISRLFTHAGFRGIKYAEETFSKEDILHAVKTSRDLNPVVANFIRNRYKIDKCDMNYYTIVHNQGHDWR